MDVNELKEYFKTQRDLCFNDAEKLNAFTQYEIKEYNSYYKGLKVFLEDYLYDIISDYPRLVDDAEEELKTLSEFFVYDELIKTELNNRLVFLYSKLQEDPFASLFNLNTFHVELYKYNTALRIWNVIYNSNEYYFKRWAKDGYAEDFKFHFTLDEIKERNENSSFLYGIDDFYELELDKLNQGISILIEAFLIKNELLNINPTLPILSKSKSPVSPLFTEDNIAEKIIYNWIEGYKSVGEIITHAKAGKLYIMLEADKLISKKQAFYWSYLKKEFGLTYKTKFVQKDNQPSEDETSYYNKIKNQVFENQHSK